MSSNGKQQSQQGQGGADEALRKLLVKFTDEAARIAVQEVAVRHGKKEKEFEEKLDRLTLFCDEMSLRLRD